MKALKLLGVGSIKDKELHKNLLHALGSIEQNYQLKMVHNINDIINHNIRSTPALIFGNQILIQGKSCTTEEIITLLSKI